MCEMFNNDLQGLKSVVGNDEGIIFVQTILRVLTQIVVRLPFDNLTHKEQKMVTEAAVTFGYAALV